MKEIHLTPIGGLGNRMRTLASVYQYCLDHDARLVVHWVKERNHIFNASFASLFQPIDGVEVIDCRPSDFFTHYVPCKRNFYFPRLIDKFTGRKAWYEIDNDILPQLPLAQGAMTIVTGSQQCEMFPLAQLFKPVPQLQRQIDDFARQMGSNVVGCHIRRTDNDLAVKESTNEKFYSRLDALLAADGEVKVYLCSDDPGVKHDFKQRYGNRIVTHQARLDRNTSQGIADAVVEMWLLSMTREILGSYWSSFSEIAAQLGNVQLSVVR